MSDLDIITSRVTMQTGPTCWFHSVFNGFLASRQGRRMLEVALQSFKRQYLRTFEQRLRFTRESINGNLQLASLHPTRAFFQVLNLLLTGTNPRVVSHGAIRGVTPMVRYNAALTEENPTNTVVEFLQSLNVESTTELWIRGPVRVTPIKNPCYLKVMDLHARREIIENNVFPPLQLDGFRISFCIIQTWYEHPTEGPMISHFITGIYDGNEQYIVDSNGYVGRRNWNTILTDQGYLDFCDTTYHMRPNMVTTRLAFYFSSSLPRVNTTSTVLAGKRTRNVNNRNLNPRSAKKQKR